MAGYYRKRGKESYELTYKGKYKTIKAAGDKEAKILLAAFIVEVESSKFRKPVTLTVRQFIEQRWIPDYVDVILAPGTANVYKTYITRNIIPLLGKLKLDKVRPAELLDFFAKLKEDRIRGDKKSGSLSPGTIQKYHRIISSMFRCAVEWQYIEESPALRVKPVKLPRKKPFSLDETQIAQLFNQLSNKPTNINY